MDGILLVNKEVGMSSYDVIRMIKKSLSMKVKIGHAGTLDPFAQGLLIVLLGKATKLQDKIHEFSKIYEVEAQFGFETDTQDITGEKISKSELPSEKEILDVLPSFIGKISQVPPKYSAVKIAGKKAYDLARKGVDVKIEPRKVQIFSLEMKEFNLPFIKFLVECSTGTYIRTLMVDIAKNAGVNATAKSLARLKIGPFKLNEAISVNDLNEESIKRGIIGMDKLSEYGIER